MDLGYVLVFLHTASPLMHGHLLDETVEIDSSSASTVLTCMAYGALSYYWLKENGEIQPNAVNINNNLILINLMPSDSGHYQCVAENNYGTTHSNFAKLTITGTNIHG